ncbi:MAG: hypothetical protein ACK4VY_03845 [Brevundimonas sp.]
MRLSVFATILVLAGAAPAAGQAPAASFPAPISAARAADVATPEAIVAALYESISGDAGVARDWDRFRALFHPSARLMPIGGPAEGPATLTPLTPDEYIARAEPFLMRGFHERETARRLERFGHMAHVFSTYDSRRAAADPQPFARGINSIQLFHDGTRWWVVSVYWQGETPTLPIPADYLPPAG